MAWLKSLKNLVAGKPRNLQDPNLYHRLSLIALFAWVGLGTDGLSSSCYGPEEAYLAIRAFPYLSIFVAMASAVTIFVISSSYSQIIELFPSGGGGYVVATKLLSPTFGMISGCALIIDYVLTITISVASGTDALFSFLSPSAQPFKLEFAVIGILVLIILNLRGIKESVLPLVPIFLFFLISHTFIILIAVLNNRSQFGFLFGEVGREIHSVHRSVGFIGLMVIMLRSYSMGAGTYTGIEAVSNGLTILREPRVETGKKTMLYMTLSLSFTVVGLMLAYLLFRVEPVAGQTLNAVLIHKMTMSWGSNGNIFMVLTLFSEACLLFVAAQTGFLDGPRVIANMALDQWFPSQFKQLNDRLVIQNGVLIMGGTALVMMLLTKGSVAFLVVLYSINVFITFVLSQLGMVRHWWRNRNYIPEWFRKFLINGIGLVLCGFILISVVALKFREGGWITLFITGVFIIFAAAIKQHYVGTNSLIRKLDNADPTFHRLMTGGRTKGQVRRPVAQYNPDVKTAVILVNGFSSIGLQTLRNVIDFFGAPFQNFVFVNVGVVDARRFKGKEEIENLRLEIENELNYYLRFVSELGLFGEGVVSIGTDVVSEVNEWVPRILSEYPNAVFFGGFLVFKEESLFSRALHNHTIFILQQQLTMQGVPIVPIPILVT